MSTTFDVTGRINAVVSAGSLNMLKKLQTELRRTANTLLKMGDAATANALGHTAMAMDKVAEGLDKTTKAAKKTATSVGAAASKVNTLKGETKEQTAITKELAKEWKLSGGEIMGLTKAVGLLGNKFGYSANAQKEWVPALRNSLVEINKQKVAMVAAGRATTAHITGQELFARTNQALASHLSKTSTKLTDYDNAMAKSLGRSPAFRAEVDKISKSVGKQGENFKGQYAALTKVDNVWRDHVTTMRKAGTVTTGQAKKMYDAYGHLGLSVKELQARIKASNGELVNSATYNKAAREELTRHTKAMTLLGKKEEQLAAVSGKSIKAIQAGTEASMKRTKSFDAVTAGIDKQIAAYKDMDKHQAKVVKGEQALARVTGARVSKIREITARMRAQGVSYEDIGKRLDSLKAKHAANTTQMGKVSKASNSLAKSNKALANEVDALGRIRLKNLAATKASAASLEALARKYPQLSKQVGILSQKVAAGNMPLAAADKVLHRLRSGMAQTTTKASMLSRTMSSLVSHLKSFASYAAAATIISGIAASFGYAVGAIIKYDQALKDLQAITQATDREVELMGEKIREVGRTTKFSAIEVAAAMRTLGQAGFTAVEAIESIDSVAALATGTLTSMKIVVDLVTTAIRAFDLEASETSRVADVFANAVNRSKLTIDKLRVAFNYIGPIAAKAGVELEETATLMMMLANAGVRASTSGTGTRRMFQQLMSPTEKFAEAIAKAGYSLDDLNPQMTDMRDIIRRLSEIVPDAQSAFEMFSLRSSAAVAALSSQGVASFDALHSATLRTGSAMEMQKTQLEGLGLIYKQAADKATDLALALGEMGVTNALRSLGKGLQDVLDLLIKFTSSGVAKVVVSVGLWVAGIYALKAAWGLLKIEVMAAAVMKYAVNIVAAAGATNKWAAATVFLKGSFGPILLVASALFVAYKLLASAKAKNIELDDKFIEDTKKRHTEERKELVTIRDLVSAIRDETSSEIERSHNLIKLQKLTENLNLKINKSTELVENYTEVIGANAEKFDDWSDAVGNFDSQAEIDNLLDNIELYERSSKAMAEQLRILEDTKEKSEAFAKEGSTWFGLFGRTLKSSFMPFKDLITQLSVSSAEIEKQEEHYRKLADTAIKSHGGIQGSLIELTNMAQGVWENQMLAAGASFDEIEGIVVDASAKITKEQLKMYLDIRAASGGYTDAERKKVDSLIRDYDRLTNSKQSQLQRDLANVRKVYTEQEEIVLEVYDKEIAALRLQPDLVGDVYDKINRVVKTRSSLREDMVAASYQAELLVIKNADLSRKDEQQEIDESNKKAENRKVARAKETAALIRELADEALAALTANYERETALYESHTEKRLSSIDRYYDHKKAKAELEEKDAAVLAEKLSNIEVQRVDALLSIAEETNLKRLASERAYHAEYIDVVEQSREQARLQFKEGSAELLEVEEELNDKLIDINKSSAEARIEIIKDWSDYLESQYDEAISKSREYANKTIEFENEIKDIRKKAAEAIVSVVESTEDKLLQVRRAGMTKTQVFWSKIAEARRKMEEANRLVAEGGTKEVLDKAGKLYEEVQNIYTGLGVQAEKAAKEGKDIGISYVDSTNAIIEAGRGREAALKKGEQLAINVKQAEIDVAKQAQKSWADLAEDIKEEIGGIQEDIEELTGLLGLAAEGIAAIESKEVDIGANEEKLNRSIRLVGDLWTNIDSLKDKTITITTKFVEERKAGGLIGNKFDRGGSVPGSGSEDTVDAKLTPGEYVIPKDRVAQYGVDFMESIRSGLLNVSDFFKFGLGGIVRAVEPAAKTLFPSVGTDDLIPTLGRMVDRLSHLSSTPESEKSSESAGGRYDFKLNIGGAALEGAASKSVLERFKVDLRRMERAGGLA